MQSLRIVTVIVLTSLIIWLLLSSHPASQVKLQTALPPTVDVDKLERNTVQSRHYITGKLLPLRKATISFEVLGQIVERHVEPGQQVTAGTVLLRVEQGDFADTVKEMKAMLEQELLASKRDHSLLQLTNDAVQLQTEEVKRFDMLNTHSMASQSKLDAATQKLLQQKDMMTQLKYAVDTSAARISMRQASLQKAERNLQRTQLIAPFTGIINAVHVNVGDYGTRGQAAVELVQLDSLDLSLNITATIAQSLKLGSYIDINTDNGKRIGEIVSIAPEPDPVTHTYAVRARIKADGLYPGQLAQAILPSENFENIHLLPLSAILYEQDNAYIFELQGDHVIRRKVTILGQHKGMQIIEGFATNVYVVTEDAALLKDGQKVTVN